MKKYIVLLSLFVFVISCNQAGRQSSSKRSDTDIKMFDKITNLEFKSFVDSFAFSPFPFDLGTTPLFADGEVPKNCHEISLGDFKKFINPDANDSKGNYTGYAVFEDNYIALIYFYSYSTMTGGLNYSTSANLLTFTFDGKLISKIFLGETNTRVNSNAKRESQKMEGNIYSDKLTTIKLLQFVEDNPSGSANSVNFLIQANGEIVPQGSTNESIVSLNPKDIVRNIKKLRQEKEINTQGFKIMGQVIYASDDSSFVIANFTETYAESNLIRTYAVATNTPEKIELKDADKDSYIEVQSYLNSSSLVYNLFYGNFSQSFDFQLDGSNDFVLKDETNFRNEVTATEQIVLFDGSNKLTTTNIKASSIYSSGGEWEGIVGKKETFQFKQETDKPAIIILEHYNDDFLGEPDKQVRTQINYNLQWRWLKVTNEWETGLVCSDCGNSMISNFTDKLTFLTEENNGFVIYENCQNGGPNFFMLKKNKTELSDMYIVDDNEDDIGYITAIHIAEVDPFTKVLYIGRGEKIEANTIGNAEIGPELSKWIVKNDPNIGDIIRIKMGDNSVLSTYTNSPKNYKTIPCNQK
jgi:hypothetical protein